MISEHTNEIRNLQNSLPTCAETYVLVAFLLRRRETFTDRLMQLRASQCRFDFTDFFTDNVEIYDMQISLRRFLQTLQLNN